MPITYQNGAVAHDADAASHVRVARARALIALLATLYIGVSASACRRGTDGPVVDTSGAPARAVEAKAFFTNCGDGRFTVLSFAAEPEHTRLLTDDFDAKTLLYVVPFTARVRFSKAIDVEELSGLATTIAADGFWQPTEHRMAVMLSQAIGPGRYDQGAELDVHASVVFEDLEPGWRVRAIDARK